MADNNILIGVNRNAYREECIDIPFYSNRDAVNIVNTKEEFDKLNAKIDKLTEALTGKTAGGIYIARTMEEAVKKCI